MTRDASSMSGLHVVVTAGGTSEPIDPVRVITNRSTGKMGLAFARAASDLGARVTLISSAGDGGMTGLRAIPMSTVESLRAAVVRECQHADVLIMTAAASDFRVAQPSSSKIKKTGDRLLLELLPQRRLLKDGVSAVVVRLPGEGVHGARRRDHVRAARRTAGGGARGRVAGFAQRGVRRAALHRK